MRACFQTIRHHRIGRSEMHHSSGRPMCVMYKNSVNTSSYVTLRTRRSISCHMKNRGVRY